MSAAPLRAQEADLSPAAFEASQSTEAAPAPDPDRPAADPEGKTSDDSSNIMRMQSGPGVFGTLSPVDGESPLRLITEHVVIYPQDDQIEIDAQYSLLNPTDQTVVEEIGFPTISVNKGYLNLHQVELSSGAPLFTRTETEVPFGEKLDYHNSLPIMDRFDLKLVWHTDTVEVAPDETLHVSVNVRIHYLYREEDLRGGTEKSKKVFHYVREFAKGWEGTPQRAILYVTPQVAQPKRLALGPYYQREKGNSFFFKFDGVEAGPSNNTWIAYDPMEYTIIKDVLGDEPLKELEPFDNRTYDYANLFDGDLFTSWCEGVQKDGKSKGFGIEWGKNKQIKRVTIFPGMNPDPELFQSRNRLKEINFYLAKPGYLSTPIKYRFEDRPYAELFAFNRRDKYTTLYVQIMETYPGKKYDATCIAEIDIEFED